MAMNSSMDITFGPVPSRRLGRSLGINNILNITAVHPMRQDAVDEILNKAKVDWHLVEKMLQNGEIIKSEFEGHTFFMRSF